MQARPKRHCPLTAYLGPFYLLQPGSVHLPHPVPWRSPRCSVQQCIDSSDPSPVPGHAADGSRRLQVPGALAPGLAGAGYRAPLGDSAGRGRLAASAKQPLALKAGSSLGNSSGTAGQGRLGAGARCSTARARAGPLRGALIMAWGLDVHPCVYQHRRSAVPKVQRLDVALVAHPVRGTSVWFSSSPAHPARRASRLSAHISRRGSHTCGVTCGLKDSPAISPPPPPPAPEGDAGRWTATAGMPACRASMHPAEQRASETPPPLPRIDCKPPSDPSPPVTTAAVHSRAGVCAAGARRRRGARR